MDCASLMLAYLAIVKMIRNQIKLKATARAAVRVVGSIILDDTCSGVVEGAGL